MVEADCTTGISKYEKRVVLSQAPPSNAVEDCSLLHPFPRPTDSYVTALLVIDLMVDVERWKCVMRTVFRRARGEVLASLDAVKHWMHYFFRSHAVRALVLPVDGWDVRAHYFTSRLNQKALSGLRKNCVLLVGAGLGLFLIYSGFGPFL